MFRLNPHPDESSKLAPDKRTGTWHEDTTLQHSPDGIHWSTLLTLKQTIMGCGVMQIHGVSSYYFEYSPKPVVDFKEAIKFLLENINNGSNAYPRDVGFFICTLGYYCVKRQEPIILDAGFVEIARYQNLAHRGTLHDVQRMYGLNVDLYEKCNSVIKNIQDVLKKNKQ